MAGMLPGVECARRRRVHQSSESPCTPAHGGTRRSSFCLYTSSYEPNYASISSSWRRMTNQSHQDQRLGEAAREAKERLDERLRTHSKSDSTSENRNHQSKERSKRCGDGILGELHTEVVGQKQGSVLAKLIKWKASEKEECAVCLERFKAGQTLLHLPCAHRFHATCLIPWLESNAHCPCCRMGVLL